MDLNTQTIPEVFEDNIKEWMGIFHTLLNIKVAAACFWSYQWWLTHFVLQDAEPLDEDDPASPLVKAQTGVVKALILYLERCPTTVKRWVLCRVIQMQVRRRVFPVSSALYDRCMVTVDWFEEWCVSSI